jgi:putative peptidoglycan lipid II flippase
MRNNAPQTESSILKNVLIVAPLSLIGRAGTLLIYIVLANWFGDTAEMDFIYYYWAIAVFLIELLSSASAYSVLVPLLAEARAKGETEAQRCVQSISSLYITIMPGLCCLLASISWAISQLFFPNTGLTPSTTIGIVCGFLIFAIISAVRWMLKAVLDTYQVFQLPVIVQGIRAAFVIGAIYLFKPALTWFSIPFALILGEIFQVLILVPRCCAVLNLRARDLKIDWQETPYTKSFLRQCLLMMGAAISDGLNPVVDRGMGSTLGASSVSKLDYALRLCAIPETLTGVTLPILLSHWAKISASESHSEDAQQLQRSVWQGVIALLVLMVPFLVLFYLFRSDIVAVLYGHGKLSEAGQNHIASLLGIYLFGMLPRLISRLLIRAHLARQAHPTVFTATLIRLILNPFLNWFFMRYWGLEGIAWSTALLSYPILAYIAIAFWQQK